MSTCRDSVDPACTAGAAVDAFRDTVLRRGRAPDVIFEALRAAPDCPLTLACAAACHLLTDTRSGVVQALALLDRASDIDAGRSTALFMTALSAVARDEIGQAEAAFLTLAAEAPDDLLAGYLGHLHFLNHGRTDAMLAQARLLTAANPGDPFALGMLAFALHEVGAVDAAWDAVLAADAVDPSIAWVHHAAGHVFLTRGALEAGGTWLAGRADHWQQCGASMLTHNWWHAQLLMLEAGDLAGVLALYDRLIAAEAVRSAAGLVNASSLLARIERRGGDVGPRWRPLAAAAATQIGEHVLPFIDLHLMLALASSGDGTACTALSRSAWRHAGTTGGQVRTAWQLAGLPLLDAVSARAQGDHRRAAQGFERGLPHLRRLGGSNQQRALFHELAR